MENTGLWTITEAARFLNIHPNTLRRWNKDGRIQAYQVSTRGDLRFKREDLNRFLNEHCTDNQQVSA
jgi:excisionase family DNA binding protein